MRKYFINNRHNYNDYQLVEMFAHDYYRIHLCTFFSQILPLKFRCALCMDPFAFTRSSLHIKQHSNSRKRVCLVLYIPSVNVHQSLNLKSCRFTITIENLLHFLEIFDDKIISMKNLPSVCFVKARCTHLSPVFLHKCRKT